MNKKQKTSENLSAELVLGSIIEALKSETRSFYIFICTDNQQIQDSYYSVNKCVGFVKARTIEEAFKITQNKKDAQTRSLNLKRSVSVGDMFLVGTEFYKITEKGFQLEMEVPHL